MANGGTIQYGIKFNLDNTNLNALKASLAEINSLTANKILNINPQMNLNEALGELNKVKETAGIVENALKNAFNQKIGTLNLNDFNLSLSKANLDLNTIYKQFASVGVTGQQSFRNLTTELLTTNLQLKQSHNLLDEMATTMSNTVKWNIASSVMNNFTNSIVKAYNYIVKLDSSLNDIRIVTNKSADEMGTFAEKANKVAESLGASTRDYTEASLIYYQQGLSDEEAAARAETTLKAANVTGQTGQEVSEQLTAVWNGYKVTAEEAELYVDKLAAVAATTASDLEELSTGMSKVASAANLMGVDIDQLNATLATVISVTRQAPESVGTAFKTIYARMGDIEAGLDAETTLGSYTEQMKEIAGINVLDANNQLRDMGEIIEEVGNKWTTFTREQQIALSQAMAGTRQYNNLLSLFDNWDMYEDALNTSKDAAGTLQEQQDIYMESAAAHIQQMKTSIEGLYDSLLDEDSIIDLTDAISNVVNLLSNFVDALGGGSNTLLAFGSIATRVFSKNLAQGIATTINNINALNNNAKQLEATYQMIENILGGSAVNDKVVKKLTSMKQEILNLGDIVTQEQHNEANEFIKTTNEIEKQKLAYQENLKFAQDFIKNNTDNNVETNFSKIEDFSPESRRTSEEYDKINDSLKEVDSKIKLNSTAINSYYKSINAVNNAREKLNKLENISVKDSGKIIEAEDNLTEKYKELEYAMNNCVERMLELSESSSVSEKESKSINNAIRNYQEAVKNNYGDSSPEIAKNLINEYEKVNERIVSDSNKTKEILDSAIEGTGNSFNKQLEQINNQWNSYISNLKTALIAKQFIDLIGTVGQLASGISALSNVVDILNDKDLTTGEKALQITMALATALPLIINSAMTITPLLYSIGVSLGVVQVAADGATVSFSAMWSAMLGPIALVTAGIAGVSAIIYGLVSAWNADSEAAKESAKAAEKLTERYQELSNAAKELKTNISDYSDAIKSLADLDSSTKEYEETLNNVNQKAKELIETYKLFDDFSIENGIITFNDGVLENLQKEINSQLDNAEKMMYSSKINANKDSITSASTDLRRELGAKFKTSAQVSTNKYNNNSFAEDYYNLSKSVQITNKELEQTANVLNNYKNSLSETELLKYNSQISTKEGFQELLSSLEGLPSIVKENINIFGDNRESILAYIDSVDEATEANNFYAQQILQGIIADKYDTEISEMSKDETGKIDEQKYNQIEAVLSKTNENISKQMEEELAKAAEVKNYDSNSKLKNFGYDIKNDEDLARTYAKEILGYAEDEVANMDFDDGRGVGTLKTADGTAIIDSYSDSQMRRQLAIKSQQSQIEEKYSSQLDATNQINAIQQLLEGADSAGQKYGTDFSNALLNALASDDQKIDLSSLFKDINPEEMAELSSMTDEEILNLFNVNEDILKTAGFNDAETFINGIKDGFTNSEWDVEDAISSSINKIGGSEKLEEYDLDSSEIEEYAKHLTEVADESDSLADSLKYDTDAAVELAKQISRMNQGIEKLADGYEDWSDILKKSDKTSQKYSEALNNMQDALGDLLDVEDELISDNFIQNHFEDIEKAANGDTEAIDRLHKALAQQIVTEAATDFGLADAEIDNLVDKLNNLEIPDIEVGARIDNEKLNTDYNDFLTTMGEIITAAGLTADETNALFGQMGFQANFATEEVPTEQVVPEYVTETADAGTVTETMEDGKKVTYVKTRTRTYQDGTYKATGKMTAIAMETSTDADGNQVKVPKINSLVRKAGGSFSNYSSSNRGGPSSPKSSGGGGSSAQEPDRMDPLEEEVDRYHSIETQITKVEKALDRLSSKQEKFIGQKLIDNLNEQWALLNTQIENYNIKLGIAIQEQNELKSKLAQKGVSFNADGTIGNYASAFQAQQNYVNSLINQYNSMSAAGQESFKATVEAAQESFDQFKEDLDRYDELVSDFIPSIYDEIEETFDKQIEINVQKFNMELEITLDMNEATREWNEWKKKVLDEIDEEDILGNSTARLQDFYTYFNENASGDIQGLSKKVLSDLEQLKALDSGQDNVFGDDKQTGLDTLKEDYEQLMDSLSNLIDLQDELYKNILDEMDAVQDKFNDQIESYETITDMIEHDMKLIQLLYGEDSYGDLAKYYELQQENYQKQLDFQQQQKDFWYAQMQAAEQGSEAWETARDNWSNAVSEFNSLLESSLENATSKFENSINNIFKNLNNSVTNGIGLDYVQEEWELINKNAEQYLDTVNATYGIRELEKKYTESINNADSVKVQQQLKKAMDQQLENLKQKDKLTQYDLDRANKLYEIQLAQIALEEAQQNKSQMRLRRDSQGNYTYQYVADEDAIADAENQLANLYNDLYNFDKQKYQENLEQIYNLWNEYQEKMAEAALINDPELRAEKELLIQEQYGELINGIVKENETIRNNLQESTFLSLSNLYEKDLMNFSDLTQQERDLLINEVGGGFTQLLEIYGVNTDAFKNMTQEQQNALIDNIINGGFNKLLETYNLDLETFKNMTQEERDTMISNMGEAFNKMLKLYGYDEESFKNLSKEKQDDLISKMGFTFETLSGFYDNDLIAFRKLSEDQQSILVESMVPQWNSAIQEMAKTFYGENGFEKNTIDAWNAIKEAQNQYQEDLDKLESSAKENFESIKNGIDENIDIITNPENGLLKANNDLIEAYQKELAAVIEVYNKVKDLRDMYAEAEQKAKDAAEAAYAYQQQEAEKNRQDAANQEITTSPAGGAEEVITPVNPTPAPPPPQPVYTGPQGNGNVDIGDKVTLTGKLARNSYASPTITPLAKYRNAQLYVQMKTDESRAAPYHLGTTPNYSASSAVGWVNKWQISGYDTGGYTGEWNKDGKLAFLHQKELVLNEQDTKNMLNAVSVIRSLAYSLGSNMLSKLAGVSATGYSNQNTNSSPLEQNVHIQAEFPNVRDASEIEEALNNLVNTAAQRIMEK